MGFGLCSGQLPSLALKFYSAALNKFLHNLGGGRILEYFLTLCHQCCANYGMDQNQTSKQSLRLHRVLTVISASNAFKEVLMNVKAKLAQVTSSPR